MVEKIEVHQRTKSPFQTLYPFRSNYLKIGENKYHFINEGVGETILMLHGNPTWSFYYRNLAKILRRNYQVVVPDHMGCGLSDKPQNYEYTLENHIFNVLSLIKELKIEKFHLIVHDWGGAIGFGVAKELKERVKSITIMNTAAFESDMIPKRIAFCRSAIGGFLVQALNAFAWPATFMTTTKPLSHIIKKAYLYPYDSFKNRIAIKNFVKDIPMEKEHRSYALLKSIEESLPQIKCPKLILWGADDFCFNRSFYEKWCQIYPEAQAHLFEKTGHYVLEDAFAQCLPLIKAFLKK